MLEYGCIIKKQEVICLNKKRAAIVLSTILALFIGVFSFASVSAYTEDDPLITLSYLEQVVLPAFKDEILGLVGLASFDDPDDEYIDASEYPEDEEENNIESADSMADATYSLLELSYGDTVMAESICEFIVRPGSEVVAVSPFPAQGIADITNGIEVLDGDYISINAYCLIPRGSDGRGMRVESENAYIMIRGDYTIG